MLRRERRVAPGDREARVPADRPARGRRVARRPVVEHAALRADRLGVERRVHHDASHPARIECTAHIAVLRSQTKTRSCVRLMDVRCEKCQTEYELDEARLKPGGVTVKCTNCGHMFKIRRRTITNVGMSSSPPTAPPGPIGWPGPGPGPGGRDAGVRPQPPRLP